MRNARTHFFATRVARWFATGLVLIASACGGGSDSNTETESSGSGSKSGTDTSLAANALKITVDGGTGGNSINSPYVEVTVCAPDGSKCKTIDHILLDTGSYGLRITAGALGSQLESLPAVQADGKDLAECAGFVSGYAWGSVRKAEVRIANQSARNLPIQVMNDPGSSYMTVPDECSETGPDLSAALGANGILGVGFLTQDCGSDCAASAVPGWYFSCTAQRCTSTAAPLASQVTNPVARFVDHSNGVTIQLPAVEAGGVESLAGTLVLGVGTASNNQIGSAQVFTANEQGFFTTLYDGRMMNGFLDSGSNGIFFEDRTIPSCSSGFYCPSDTLSLSATVRSADGGPSRTIKFSVESAARLPESTVAAHLGGDVGMSAYFDWGLPFFFGRKVFVALSGAQTSGGIGPFWAF